MIDVEEVKRIASLAKLELDAEGLEKMSGELSRILDYIDKLRELEGAEPGDHEIASMEPREDRLVDSLLDADGIAANAPDFRNGFFVVPPVIG